jgi:hypothetical protein
MSAVGTITKLATEVVGKAAHAVTHPRQTVTAVTGHAKDLASTVTGGEKASIPTDTGGPHRNVEPAEPVPPAKPVEPSTTEPKAASRDGAHHGRGSEPSDDWHDEVEDAPDVGVNPATGQPNQGQSDEGPLIDPSIAKAVRSESEVLGRAADPDKDQHKDPGKEQ